MFLVGMEYKNNHSKKAWNNKIHRHLIYVWAVVYYSQARGTCDEYENSFLCI